LFWRPRRPFPLHEGLNFVAAMQHRMQNLTSLRAEYYPAAGMHFIIRELDPP
jgi:hypothetical protein